MQGNKDPTPATFSWTILTPQQAVQNVTNTIEHMHLPRGTTTSLEAPLNTAINQLNRNNDVAACNTLNAFLHQVDAKEANRQLTSAQAPELRQQATAIRETLGCSSSSSSSSLSGVMGMTESRDNPTTPNTNNLEDLLGGMRHNLER